MKAYKILQQVKGGRQTSNNKTTWAEKEEGLKQMQNC